MEREAQSIAELIAALNAKTKDERLQALRSLVRHKDFVTVPSVVQYVNNHIHTIYSFSPYSPTMAVYKAYESGLCTCGIMDHDSIGGAREFIEAGNILGIETTVGVEVRIKMSDTCISDRKINNPDQKGVAYVALHGIASNQIDKIDEWLAPFRFRRNLRNKAMVNKINAALESWGVSISYNTDVLPLSKSRERGTITERHLMMALSLKLIEKFGKGEGIVKFLEDMGVVLTYKQRTFMLDKDNIYYSYDLLGILKAELMEMFYIDADTECPSLAEYLKIARKSGAITAYAYLGDVTSSVTGDKKAQTFEDSYIDTLFLLLKELNFDAVTYMPTRNSVEQLIALQQKCDHYNLFQISGEDINSPRQSFIIEALKKPEFAPLIVSTWALINHEKRAGVYIDDAMFSVINKGKYPNIKDRIQEFSNNL